MNQASRTWSDELLLIVGAAIVITVVSAVFGMDLQLAYWAAGFAGSVTTFSQTAISAPGLVVVICGLIFLSIPIWRERYPLLRRCAAVWIVTFVVGHNAFIEGDLKAYSDRPRPNEIQEFNGQRAFKHPFARPEGRGSKSFPSGSAAMGFLFATPYFVLRERHRSAARAFLVGGLLFGALIGLNRMIAQMHFFTDIVWSAAIILGLASVLSHLEVGVRGGESRAATASSALDHTIFSCLRLGAAFCFIGHGMFGFITKAAWLPFFAVVGIEPAAAYKLMPLVGTVDVFLGVCTLFVLPRPAFAAYMTFWGIWTALLRPLSGLGWWEFFERAGNYGVPFALVVLARCRATVTPWFGGLSAAAIDEDLKKKLLLTLRLTTAALMIGHGGYGFVMQKQMLIDQLTAMGLNGLGVDPLFLIRMQGLCEILLGAAVLLIQRKELYLICVIWKIATELFYPLSGDYIWEFIERAGSYTAPLAAYFLLLKERGSEDVQVTESAR